MGVCVTAEERVGADRARVVLQPESHARLASNRRRMIRRRQCMGDLPWPSAVGRGSRGTAIRHDTDFIWDSKERAGGKRGVAPTVLALGRRASALACKNYNREMGNYAFLRTGTRARKSEFLFHST